MRTLISSVVLATFPLLGISAHVDAARSIADSIPDGAPVVTIANGTVYGQTDTVYSQDYFLGVRFAQPPTGALRFAAPQPLNATYIEPLNASGYGPECIGYGYAQWILGNDISEDCLSINIVRPTGTKEGDNLPVAIWIHGGYFKNGGAMDPRYNLSFIVQQSVAQGTPMIAASIQYRLSFWGWMFSNEMAAVGAGNLGLRDQRLALHWVQENIGAFGGDPTRVTLWGESAGAFSVGYQLVAYGGRDDNLFHQAILQSGAPSAKFPTASDWQPYFDALVQEVNCNGASDVLNCLRAVPVETLNGVFNSTVITVPQAPFFAAYDNDFMTVQGQTALYTGQFLKVPAIMGINTDEGTSFVQLGINTTDQFLAYVKLQGATDDTANTVATLYPDIPSLGIPATLVGRPDAHPWGLQYKRAAAFYGDLLLHVGRRFMTQAWANQSLPVYSYRFNVLVNGATAQIGSTHFEEVPFVFHNTISNGYGLPNGQPKPFVNVPSTFGDLADIMSGMWIAFIVTGDPNNYHPSECDGSNDTCVQWPTYTTNEPQNIVFDVNVTDLFYVEPDEYRQREIAYLLNTWAPPPSSGTTMLEPIFSLVYIIASVCVLQIL